MPPLIRAFSRRDAVLILVGAFLMHFFATMAPLTSRSIINTARFPEQVSKEDFDIDIEAPPSNDQELDGLLVPIPSKLDNQLGDQGVASSNNNLSRLVLLPETAIIEHVPGWTIFRDIYMANGTLWILTSSPSSIPEIRYMTSTGLPANGTTENKELREPTPWDMNVLSPEEARKRWGTSHPSSRRVWSIEGNTLLFNDPPQFLHHYYHFCAELILGAWSFWTGAVYPAPPPVIHRAIFPHSSNTGWRDVPGFNGYFLRAAFPSLTVEVDLDWSDRVLATSTEIDSGIHRAWHFPYLLLADRSAAFRGELCGSLNQRTASESVDALISRSKLDKHGLWWRTIRNAVWRFAGVAADSENVPFGTPYLSDNELILPLPEFEETEKVVITYISRQNSRRRLIEEDHGVLVKNLEALVQKKNAEIRSGHVTDKMWELNVVMAEKMTKDEQVQLAARTTILLGVHGNGLSHLILMPRTNVSAVVEIFYPGGFAHDYEWTTHALGMRYFGIWNDTYFTGENTPAVMYPEGFQGSQIPVFGSTVASVIEKRIAGEL